MDTLFSRYRNVMLLVAVLFIQLVMLAFQVKRERDVPLIRVWAVSVITPIEKVSSGTVRAVVGTWQNYLDLRHTRQENQTLSEEVHRLKLNAYQLHDEAQEARRLEALLDFKRESQSEMAAARVIGSSASETSRVLFIDRGSEAHIRRNMAVITPDGIVGKVYRVFHGASQVLVITDPDSGVGALLADSRLHGPLRGVGGFFCQMRYIPNEEKVELGDRVFTSGEDMIYPKGLPIGTVSSIRPGPVFKEITVQPSAKLNRLEEVLVVLRGADQEIPDKPEPAPAPAAAEEVPPAMLPGPIGKPGSEMTGPAAAPAAKPREGKLMPVATQPGETDADRLMLAAREKAAAAAAARATGAARPATPPAAGQTPAPGTAPAGTQALPAVKKTAPGTTPPGTATATPGMPGTATGAPGAAGAKKTTSPAVTAPAGTSVRGAIPRVGERVPGSPAGDTPASAGAPATKKTAAPARKPAGTLATPPGDNAVNTPAGASSNGAAKKPAAPRATPPAGTPADPNAPPAAPKKKNTADPQNPRPEVEPR